MSTHTITNKGVIRVYTKEENEMILLRVKDNGVGIEPTIY